MLVSVRGSSDGDLCCGDSGDVRIDEWDCNIPIYDNLE